jgi:transposase
MKAYSVDLRQKIVDALLRRRMLREKAARTFGVGATSVKRYVVVTQKDVSLTLGRAPGRERSLDESGIMLLEEDLHARPSVSYERRAEFLHRLLGIRLRRSTICWAIRRMDHNIIKIGGCK